MELEVFRTPSRDGATIGKLSVDGVYECFTLEDQIREVPGEPVRLWKVPGQTAIPSGRYRVIVTPSVRFRRPLPLLLDVPGFSGIRIHCGNGTGDTCGCLLVGRTKGPTHVGESRLAFDALFPRIERATGDIWIAVHNPATE